MGPWNGLRAGLSAFCLLPFLAWRGFGGAALRNSRERKKVQTDEGFFCRHGHGQGFRGKTRRVPTDRRNEIMDIDYYEYASARWFVFHILGKFWICTGDDQGLLWYLVEDASFARSRVRLTPARPASWLRHLTPGSDASHPPLRGD